MASTKKGGLANPKQKKYASIRDYVEAHHKPVYNLYAYMGMNNSLTPKRGGGITLLLPDSKMVAHISKLSESEDAEKATDILSGLIIPDYLGDAKAWAEKQDDIPNLLGKRIQVKSVSAGKVVLEGGAELTLDTKAKFLDRVGTRKRDPMAVWIVKGDFDPVSGPESSFKYVTKGGKPKKNSGRKRGGLASAPHKTVDPYVEKIFEKAKSEGNTNAFMVENMKVAKVLNGDAQSSFTVSLKQRVQELTPWCHVSRFLFTFDNAHYVSDLEREDLVKAVEACPDYELKESWETFMRTNWGSSKALVATEAGRAQVHDLRQRVRDRLAVRGGKMSSEMTKVYQEYENKNQLAGQDNVSYDATYRVFYNKSGLKQAMDQLKFMIGRYLLQHPGREGIAKVEQLAKWSNTLGGKVAAGDKAATEISSYLNFDWIPGLPTDGLLNMFLQSCSFMSVVCDKESVVGAGEYDEEEAENPFSREMANDDALGVAQYEAYEDKELKLSQRALNELAAYKAKHGKLPDV